MSGWVLHLGDCLDPVSGIAALADKSVDHIVMDPPYETEAHHKGKRQGPGFTGGDYARGITSRPSVRVVDETFTFDPITETERDAIGIHAGRVCRGRVIVFCQVEAVTAWRASLERGGLIYRRTIPWVKPDAMPSLHGRWPGQSFEAIVLAQQPRINACPVGGKARYYEHTRRTMARDDRPHPTVKPLALMLDIVEDFTRPGDLILDPFAGSGSTGVAAVQRGRGFIGWERDPGYHAIATRRLAGDEAKPRAEQPSLFGGRP